MKDQTFADKAKRETEIEKANPARRKKVMILKN